MTNEQKRRNNLTNRGLFLSEIRAWSGFNWSEAPWLKGMLKDRHKVTRQWASRQGVSLRDVKPEDLRKSLTYQRAVRQFYDSHDWTKARVRHEPSGVKKTYSIDPYAMMRYYSAEYSEGPGEKTYMPPWRKREKTKGQKNSAIDQQFSTAVGLARI